ncbi:MAG TPA: Calx-beta domain-containing protein, partial [Nitriliruptorales bacterium]
MRRHVSTVLTLALAAGMLAALPAAPALAAPTISFAATNLPGIVDLESESFTYTLELSEAPPLLGDPVSVDWRVEHVTTDDADFGCTAPDCPPSGTVEFPLTATTVTFEVEVATDSVAELDESFEVVLSDPINATISGATALGHILDDDTPTVTITGPVDDAGEEVAIDEPASGTADAVFTLELQDSGGIAKDDDDVHVPVAVTWRTVDRSAVAGQDYVGVASQTTTIPAGQASKTIAVAVSHDTVVEGDNPEFFEVELLSATHAELGETPEDRRARAEIVDDDIGAANTIRLLTPDPIVEPSGTGTEALNFPLVVSQTTHDPFEVTVTTFDGSATGGDDYVARTELAGNATVMVPEDATTVDIPVMIKGDSLIEATETFTLTISDPTEGFTIAGSDTATGTILDPDGPTVTIDEDDRAVAVSEGDPAEFNVHLDEANETGADIVVGWTTRDGSASAAEGDYSPTSGTVTFGAGEQDRTITVQTAADSRVEGTESFRVRLTDPGTATLGSRDAITGSATIWDDDTGPLVRVFGTEVLEGDSGTTPAVFTLELDKAVAHDVTVRWRTANGTAGDGTGGSDSDYVPQAAGSTVIPAGKTTASLTVAVKGDTKFEQNETFKVVLTADTTGARLPDLTDGGQATATIINDDGARFAVRDTSAPEGDTGSGGTAEFEVELLGESAFDVCNVARDCPTTDNPFVVSYTTRDGTDDRRAVSTTDEFVDDVDYAVTTGELMFGPADPRIQRVRVTLVGDEHPEASEWFTLEISLPDEGANENATIRDKSGRGVITNDDDDGSATFSIGDAQIIEGDSGQSLVGLVVTLEGSPPDGTTPRVSWATQDDADGEHPAQAGTDYVASSGVLEFPSGTTEQTLAVPVRGDLATEFDETFLVELSEPDFVTIADGTGTVTIVNDDGPRINVSDAAAEEPGAGTLASSATFTLSLSAPSTNKVTVAYATEDGTATEEGGDYVGAEGTAVFPAGTTQVEVDVPVLGDDEVEGAETFTLVLSEPVLAVLSDAVGTGTITDPGTGGGGGGGGSDGGGSDGGDGGDGEQGEVFRSFGEGRIETAVAVSADHWPSADAAVLATAWAFPDALAGGSLAAGLRAPLLLTRADELPTVVAAELERLGVSQVWILGGPAAVGPEVEQAVEDLGIEVVRVAGEDRFETAATIARSVQLPASGEVILALGQHPNANRSWPDALSAGSLAASIDQLPTLLARPDELPEVTEEALADLGALRVLVL